MIYMVLFVYDDVVDEVFIWCGVDMVYSWFDVCVVVFVGDFFFVQVSWYFVNFDDFDVVKLFSCVIMDFVDGEVKQGFYCFDMV